MTPPPTLYWEVTGNTGEGAQVESGALGSNGIDWERGRLGLWKVTQEEWQGDGTGWDWKVGYWAILG